MAHALGLERADMLMRQRDLSVPASFAGYMQRRLQQEPVAYITGYQHFWDLRLAVAPGVLIPRQDSETLIEEAGRVFAGKRGPVNIIDLGTGSGALIMAALSIFPDARGLALDASAAALRIAEVNRQELGFADRLTLRQIDWCEPGWAQAALSGFDSGFDLILCNPPYVETAAALSPMVRDFEPASALFAGDDGMDDYKRLIPQIAGLMAGGGAALFEIGYTQAESVGALARDAGFDTEMKRDLAGQPRVLTLRRV